MLVPGCVTGGHLLPGLLSLEGGPQGRGEGNGTRGRRATLRGAGAARKTCVRAAATGQEGTGRSEGRRHQSS